MALSALFSRALKTVVAPPTIHSDSSLLYCHAVTAQSAQFYLRLYLRTLFLTTVQFSSQENHSRRALVATNNHMRLGVLVTLNLLGCSALQDYTNVCLETMNVPVRISRRISFTTPFISSQDGNIARHGVEDACSEFTFCCENRCYQQEEMNVRCEIDGKFLCECQVRYSLRYFPEKHSHQQVYNKVSTQAPVSTYAGSCLVIILLYIAYHVLKD